MTVPRAALPLVLALALAGCPQPIPTGADGGTPADAAYEPPQCSGGPEFTCTPAPANPARAVLRDHLFFNCPVTNASGRAVVLKGVPTDHASLVVGTAWDPAKQQVELQPSGLKPGARFADADVTAYVTLAWQGSPDECGVAPVTFKVAGNVWVADEATGRVLVYDSAGRPFGDPIALQGLAAPRALAAYGRGQVLAAGLDGPTVVVAVYDHAGAKSFDIERGTRLSGKSVRSLAMAGAALFVTTGTTDQDGELFLGAKDAAPDWVGSGYGGLAEFDGGGALAGSAKLGSYSILRPNEPKGTPFSTIPFKEGASPCGLSIRGVAAVARLELGGFAFSMRHGTTAPYLGMLGLVDAGMVVKAQTAHTATDVSKLSSAGAWDWLEELAPGVLLGSRDRASGVQRIEAAKIGVDDAGAVTTWAGTDAVQARGLLRLR